MKAVAMLGFFQMEHYDAVTLSSRETQRGFAMWEQAAQGGAPIVVANLFKDPRGKLPVFTPHVIKKDGGRNLAVIGLISESAWNSRADTSATYVFKSPLAMGRVIKRVAKKSDHLTVLGEFTTAEADTLVSHFPEIDLVVSSGIKSAERARLVGNSVIIGSANRGYYGNYIDFSLDSSDSTHFHPEIKTLDESIPVDTAVQNFVNSVNQQIKAGTNIPASSSPDQH